MKLVSNPTAVLALAASFWGPNPTTTRHFASAFVSPSPPATTGGRNTRLGALEEEQGEAVSVSSSQSLLADLRRVYSREEDTVYESTRRTMEELDPGSLDSILNARDLEGVPTERIEGAKMESEPFGRTTASTSPSVAVHTILNEVLNEEKKASLVDTEELLANRFLYDVVAAETRSVETSAGAGGKPEAGGNEGTLDERIEDLLGDLAEKPRAVERAEGDEGEGVVLFRAPEASDLTEAIEDLLDSIDDPVEEIDAVGSGEAPHETIFVAPEASDLTEAIEDLLESIDEPVEFGASSEAAIPLQEKAGSDLSWFDVLGAAAEAAGAIGGVAVRAASQAMEGVVPREALDVSVPYESASFLAYTEWLLEHGKEDRDLERYDDFRRTYREVTISNVVTKKKIRDGLFDGENAPSPRLAVLNQYADLPEEEYRARTKALEPKSLGSMLGDFATFAQKAATDAAGSVVGKAGPDADGGKALLPEPGPKQALSFLATKMGELAASVEKKEAPETEEEQPTGPEPEAARDKPFSFLSVGLPGIPKESTDEPVVADATSSEATKPKAFSFLSGGLPKARAKSDENPPTVEKPTAQQAKPGLAMSSFLSAPSLKPKKAPPKEQKAKATKTKITSFLSVPTLRSKKAPANKPKEEPKSKVPSFLSVPTLASNKKPKTEPKPKISSFLSGPTLRSKKPAKSTREKNKATGLFGNVGSLGSSGVSSSSKNKKTAPIPSLAKWKQNRDGSITGYISNSEAYATGTKITTSPVPENAKAGIVQTESGSRYRLK